MAKNSYFCCIPIRCIMRLLPLLYVLLALSACHTSQPCVVPTDYLTQQETWRQERLDELLTPTGWIALVGLHWISAGDNTLGSDSSNQIILPAGAPAHLGTIQLTDRGLKARFEPGVLVNGVPATEWSWSEGEQMAMMEKDQWTWTIIERGGRYALRLWDTSLPTRIRMREIPHFPDAPKWWLPAQWIPAAQPETVVVRNALGMDIPTTVVGKMMVQWAGKSYPLLAFESGPDELFIIFMDDTSGDSTYPAGRYLYCPRPATAGPACIDFNRAINPPCAFTEYATCLLPPAGNTLPLSVEAGEQYENEH